MILVRGLPGSGKTYVAAELQKSIGEIVGKDAIIMLDPDATDYESKEYQEHAAALTAEGVDEKLHAYRFLRGNAYQGIAANKIIIWNQPFTNLEIFNKMVAKLQAQAAEHQTQLPILVVEVEIDIDTAKARVDKRKSEGGHGPSEATFTRFTNDYFSFANHGYNTVTVHGEDDVADSVTSVMLALQRMI
jgi:adenylate kinase family enzyme